MTRRKYLLIFVALVTTMLYTCKKDDGVIDGFPQGEPSRLMKLVVENFKKTFDDTLTIESVRNIGTVANIDSALNRMMNSLAIIGYDSVTHAPTVFTKPDVVNVVSNDVWRRWRETLRLNLSAGDILIEVKIEDKKKNKAFTSINSMHPKGTTFSGIFFLTSRVPTSLRTSVKLPNTVCHTEVLTAYLWGSPAETIRACVRARCNGTTVASCFLTDLRPFPGFFAEIKTLPLSPGPGRIDANCCYGEVSYAWATGFKSVKVKTGGTSLEVEGTIGQGTNGFFSVEECCNPPVAQPFGTNSSSSINTKTCESELPDVKECWDQELPDGYYYYSMEEALHALEELSDDIPPGGLHETNEREASQGPCVGEGGLHWDVFDRRGKNRGSITGCPCCLDEDNGPEIRWRYRIFPA